VLLQVIDLQVFAVPRITLKPLVPSFPCFAKILVSLMEKVNMKAVFIFCVIDVMTNLCYLHFVAAC
jgi:hypothetical protein